MCPCALLSLNSDIFHYVDYYLFMNKKKWIVIQSIYNIMILVWLFQCLCVFFIVSICIFLYKCIIKIFLPYLCECACGCWAMISGWTVSYTNHIGRVVRRCESAYAPPDRVCDKRRPRTPSRTDINTKSSRRS